MKTRIYFIIMAIVQIVLAIYCIFTADSIQYEQQLELPGELALLAMSTNEIILMSVIDIILSIIIGIFALKNKIKRRKGLLITLCIIILITTPSNIMAWIAIANIIVLLFVKKERAEKGKIQKAKFNYKQAEETLKIEGNKITKKQIIILALMGIIYFMQLLPSSLLPESKTFILTFIISIYVFLFVLSIVVFWKELKQSFKKLGKNFKIFLKYMLRVMGIMYAFYYLANLISFFATNKMTSVNQETIEMLPILLVAPIAIIWAPVVEETLFRGAFRKIIKNEILYIIISSVAFGALHVIHEASLTVAISAAIPYIIIGVAFSYMYAKTNNLAVSIVTHSAWNTLGVILMLLVK